MAVADNTPVLYLIACGAGPARQLPDFAEFALARHPAFGPSVARLREWGVRVILDPAGLPGAEDPDAAVFPWQELRAALASLRRYDVQ